MEVLLVIGAVVVVFFVLIAVGNAKGPPNTTDMTIEQMMGRIQSEEAWVRKFQTLDFRDRKPDLVKKYEEKKLYITILQMTIAMKAKGEDLNNTLIPVLNRQLELMRGGMNEKEAQTKASEEFIAKRDGKIQ